MMKSLAEEPLSFCKYVGCGNDFILIDNRQYKQLSPSFLSALCHRQQGIGADGVLLLEHSSSADYRMRVFNSDGSEAEMCGNGIRCLAKYLHELIPTKKQFLIETMLDKISVYATADDVEVTMPSAPFVRESISLTIEQITFLVHFIEIGVPHVVIFCNENRNDLFENYARKIRFHAHFNPKGTNVNFVQLCSHNAHLCIRTYERGVEGETLSCGTGAVAAALVAACTNHLLSPIKVHNRSGNPLLIAFEKSKTGFYNIRMQGPAIKIFEGKVTKSIAF